MGKEYVRKVRMGEWHKRDGGMKAGVREVF
jgi:hypothetical protein